MWAMIQYKDVLHVYQYRKSHCGDKTVVRSSYLHNGISYTGKMSSLYWIRAMVVIRSSYLHNGNCYTGKMALLYWISLHKLGNSEVKLPLNLNYNDKLFVKFTTSLNTLIDIHFPPNISLNHNNTRSYLWQFDITIAISINQLVENTTKPHKVTALHDRVHLPKA